MASRRESYETQMLRTGRRRAKAKGFEFSLTREWVKKKLDARRCEVTGLHFFIAPDPSRAWSHPRRPSIDRIDSTKGYTEDNCQMVVWQYNCAKGEWALEWLLQVCERVLERS